MRFTIGAGDRQCLQPPLSTTIPATKKTVAILFQELGQLPVSGNANHSEKMDNYPRNFDVWSSRL